MTNRERILKMHEAICKCITCKGEQKTDKLCPPCKALDEMINSLRNEPDTETENVKAPAKNKKNVG
jgi:hypothetical protein